ncbi:MAG: hypothetical protein LC798_15405 [Chloroflexi bacterium]|nr:hypothetical protein [Chloroflexota bacterium]
MMWDSESIVDQERQEARAARYDQPPTLAVHRNVFTGETMDRPSWVEAQADEFGTTKRIRS